MQDINDKRILVIAADRKNGRIFTIFLGNFEDEGRVIKDSVVPQKIKDDNARQGKVDRHVRNHLHKHLRLVIDEAEKYVSKNKLLINAVVIGGHKELLSEIRSCLPPHLKRIVAGELVCEPDAPLGEITEKVKQNFQLFLR